MTRISWAVVAVCLLSLVGESAAVQADSNLHTMDGTMEHCECECVPIFPPPALPPSCDQICFARLSIAAPAPHYTAGDPVIVPVELQGEAVHECGVLYPLLPRKVQVLYWMEFGGRDFGHGGRVRTQAKGYKLIDFGSP